jgi:hypothetical protein
MQKEDEPSESNRQQPRPFEDPKRGPFVLDQLLAFGKELKDKHMRELHERFPRDRTEVPDAELCQPYLDAVVEAEKLCRATGSNIPREELQRIEKAVRRVKDDHWKAPPKGGPGKPTPKSSAAHWDECARAFASALDDLPLVYMTRSRAKTIMASYAYKVYIGPSWKFPFFVAWTELCRIKAAAGPGGHAAIRQDFANGMAVSSTYLRALEAATA